MNGAFSIMLSRRRSLFSLSLILIFFSCQAEFTPDFHDFIVKNYGSEVTTNLTRADLGMFNMGSFGGKEFKEDEIKNKPVIFLHGVTQRAGVYLSHRTYFEEHGYDRNELYATSWGDGGLTPMYDVTLKCEYVKQVRQFITAVNKYANQKVDVIAYSMGVAVSRKAILGGKCVDTEEYLGPPLTKYVDVYVALGGVVRGVEFCPDYFNGCNKKNGFSCRSAYLGELNRKKRRYEGQHSFAIYSPDDRIVGQNCCGKQCSELPNANVTIKRPGFNHLTLFFGTQLDQNSLTKLQKTL
ncbi:hypothetical protein L596_005881 [Steinernema carpocapsae]|uniref:Lipase domain-containing protein n=1 Tax=Steinernema carpocapsae TaxID=34508 RepID=A0A4U8V1Z4_STECR|nr:hypothetical protein L596_005881 [Steinernema carpocapsae]